MRRFEITIKNSEGTLRQSVNTEQEMHECVATLQADPRCLWIVVKDRCDRGLDLEWQREGESIDWWVRAQRQRWR